VPKYHEIAARAATTRIVVSDVSDTPSLTKESSASIPTKAKNCPVVMMPNLKMRGAPEGTNLSVGLEPT
jgi:hypothetical protein